MRKYILLLFLVVTATGCCICKQKESVQISVFAEAIMQVAKTREISIDESAALLAEAGIAGFETNYQDPNLPELVKTNLRPINLYGWVTFLAPDNGAQNGDEFIDVALKYGVPKIMIIPDNFSKDGDQEADYLQMCEGLKKLIKKATAAGLIVTVENFGNTDNPCSYAKYLKRFLTDIPELGFTIDSGNLYYAGRGDDIMDMAHFAKERIRHVHLKDQTPEDNRKYVTLGTGAVPNKEVVQLLHKSGYHNWFTLENPVGEDILVDVHSQAGLLRSWIK